ncbi:MAG: ribosome-binding factor A [Gammaproteobacteria bacterium RIFCSPLOWO2_02_47_7]|nr:MAG: ribosome-binding factor A [Gammaproteobacteria bacterium RIFCSPLOWO2_02_47_7]
MAKEFSRSRRVADLIQRELAGLIQRDIRDHDLGMVTLSTIDVSPDLKNAKVFFTCIGNTATLEQVVVRLNAHIGQFRHELSKTLILRSVPKLKFVYDYSLDRANKLTSLIDSLHIDASDTEQNPDQQD